jgi:glyoxylase-like metal-dependent hydrolase (beta-lactamase superfamily II)
VKTRQITPSLTQLTQFHFVNAFLVREQDGLTLVDTTMGNAAGAILAAAAQTGLDIRRVAITHGHGDHVGGLDALKERLGESVEVLMPELDARLRSGEQVVEGKVPGSWPTIETRPDTLLHEGDRVRSLEVIAAPGHSPGHIAFLDTRDRALIAGDVFTTYGRAAVTDRFYWRFPFAAMATWDKVQDRESARKLRALEPSLLAVGHGPAIHLPVAAMDAALATGA